MAHTDIIDRLKDLISQMDDHGTPYRGLGVTLVEALAEIERLRDELADYQEMVASFEPEEGAS